MSNQIAGDLKFIGLSEDGEHLIVTAPSGETYRLRVTPMVRAAVRHDRSAMEAAKADHEGSLPPREIQARIRAGMTAQEIAEKSHIPLELVQRYEGPVLAERQFTAEKAQKVALSAEPDAPTLGQIVLDRLATRGVNTLDLIWDAYKTPGHGWIITCTFDLDSDIRVARWTYKASARSVTAIDDDAKWLSETRISDEPIPRRHLSAVQNAVFDFEAVTAQSPRTGTVAAVVPAQTETEELLDRLNRSRGQRPSSASSASSAASDSQSANIYAFNSGTRENNDVVYDNERLNPSVQDPSVTAERPAVVHTHYVDASRESAQSARSSESDATLRRLPSMPDQADTHPPLTSALSALSLTPEGTSAEPLTPVGSGQTPSGNTPVEPPSATDLFGDEVDDKFGDSGQKKSKARGRSPMPTWEEIMFGAKPE